MILNDNQFLKIRKINSSIDFEVIEIQEKSKRPKRWHIAVPMMNLVNRHTKPSKIKLLQSTIYFLQHAVDTKFEE